MLVHMVSFKLKSEANEQVRQTIVEKFQQLAPHIHGLIEMSVGRNVTVETEQIHGYDFGLYMKFEDQNSIVNYLNHEKHLKVKEYVMNYVEHAIVCDLEIGINQV